MLKNIRYHPIFTSNVVIMWIGIVVVIVSSIVILSIVNNLRHRTSNQAEQNDIESGNPGIIIFDHCENEQRSSHCNRITARDAIS